jgi:hypothetical protein
MRKRLTDTGRLKTSAASSGRREIPEDYKYNPKKLKHLKHILHNVSVALGTLTSSFNEFSRFKGPDISPDGRLGGAGYILPLKDIKQAIQNSVYSLSDVADCIADELTNPKWESEKDPEVKELVKEKDEAVNKIEEDISPGDVTGVPPEEEEKKEEEDSSPPPVPEIKMSSNKKDVLATAVRQSLLNFFED